MTTVNEAEVARTQLGSTLKAGIDTLSLNQTVTFELYARVVLPLDGYVFWLKAQHMTPTALLTIAQKSIPYCEAVPPLKLVAQGSLHYATVQDQTEDSTYATNTVVFTSEQPIQDFNETSPQFIYISTFDGIRFAFNQRGSYYVQSNTWHYRGNAVYSTMASQIIDDPKQLDTSALIVSNSLPIWLAINTYAPAYPVLIPFPSVTLYPSYLSPTNLTPPYGTVHVEPEATDSLQAAPAFSRTLDRWQLSKDRVVVTLYGLNNLQAMNFLDATLQYSYDTSSFGVMNIPAVRDDKKTQSELAILAEKKHIIFEVNYYQQAARNIARQLIEEVIVQYYAGEQPFPPQ